MAMDLILIALINTGYPDNFILLGKATSQRQCANMGIKQGYSITFRDDQGQCFGIATFNDLDQCRIPEKFQYNHNKR
jgi:hypothetical protein